MSKPTLQQHALRLRSSGFSVNAIAKKLEVSKSTVSYWCKDITLTDEQINLIAERSHHHATASLLRASEKQRAKRQTEIIKATKFGRNDIGKLSKRDIHMVGLGLYWGEGYKKGNQELGFTNSDPAMILFYIHWLRLIFLVPKSDLILRVSINNQHEKRVAEVLNYWSTTTKILLSQFTKISLIKSLSKKNYHDPNSHFGTLRVKVRKGTHLRRRILGSISALQIR